MSNKEPKPKKTLNVFPDTMKALPRILPADVPERSFHGVDVEPEALKCDRCDQVPVYAGKLWVDGDELALRLCGKCYIHAGNPPGFKRID